MNICFEILLPKEMNLSVIGVYEQFITWGEEQFSQDPPIFIWNQELQFKQAYDAALFKRLVGKAINLERYSVFTLVGDVLDNLQYLVNTQQDISDDLLVKFIQDSLLKLNDWVIIMSIDDEQVDECIQLEHKEDVIPILCESINWNIGKGLVLIYGG